MGFLQPGTRESQDGFTTKDTENTKEEKEDKKLVSFLRGEMNLMREAGEKSRAIYVFLCKE